MKSLIIVIATVFALTTSSCRKCTICTKDGDPDVRLCEKDYGSHTEYGLAIDIYEAQNYNCK